MLDFGLLKNFMERISKFKNYPFKNGTFHFIPPQLRPVNICMIEQSYTINLYITGLQVTATFFYR